MAAVRSVLVPLDGSRLAEQALSAAVSLVRRLKCPLHLALVHQPIPWAVSPSPTPVLHETDSGNRAREHEYLASLGVQMQNWNLTVTTTLLDGSVAKALGEYVARADVDLVVMTTHGRGGVNRAWLGSVADRLVRSLSVPVLLMRPTEDTKRPVMDGMFRRILIPLDGSMKAEAAIEPALALGTLCDAEYLLVRIVEPKVSDYLPTRGETEISENSLAGRDLDARRYLRSVMERLWTKDAKVQTRVLVGTSPAVEVLRQAATADSSLIAMATRGLGGVERLLVGSVADKVLRGADIPVLIIRPQDLERGAMDLDQVRESLTHESGVPSVPRA